MKKTKEKQLVKHMLAWVVIATMVVTMIPFLEFVSISQNDTTNSIASAATHSGKQDNLVDWEITDSGELIIGKAGQTQQFARTANSDAYTSHWDWQDYNFKSEIKSIKFVGTVKGNGSHRNMFQGLENLESVNLTNFKSEDITDIDSLFYSCSKLTNINMGGFGAGITSLRSVFAYCSSLTNINFMSTFNTSDVTSFERVFENCYGLTSENLDLSKINIPSNAWSLEKMFSGCSGLTTDVHLEKLNSGNITTFTDMFLNCSNLTELNVNRLNTSKARAMDGFLSGCSKLTDEGLQINNLNVSNVLNLSRFFSGCSSLTVSPNLSNWNTANATNMSEMFANCSKLTSLDVTQLNTANVTNFSGMFKNCSKLVTENFDISEMNTAKATNMASMFEGCSSLTELDLDHFNVEKVSNFTSMFANCKNITSDKFKIATWNTQSATKMDSMFSKMTSLTSLDLEHFKTSKVATMTNMFDGCTNMTSSGLKVSSWNLGALEKADYMFRNCDSLTTSLDLSGWNTSNNLQTMTYMFDGCDNLTDLDITQLNTSSAVLMQGLFRNCPKLTSVGIGEDNKSISTGEVTNMTSMFEGCSSLKNLDLSSLDFTKLFNVGSMFKNCTELETLNLTGPLMDNANPVTVTSIFEGCAKLKTVDTSFFNDLRVSNASSAFKGRSSLTEFKPTGMNLRYASTIASLFENCSGLTKLDLSDTYTARNATKTNMLKGLDNLLELKLGENSNINNTGLTSVWTKDFEKYYEANDLMDEYDGTPAWVGTYYRGYVVTYHPNGVEGVQSAKEIVKVGEKAKAEGIDFVCPGYTFEGWFADSEGNTEFDFDKIIEGDTDIYAKWSDKEYTVNYETNGAGTIEPKTGIKFRDANLAPADKPYKKGYAFKGWFIDQRCRVSYENDKYADITNYDDTITSITLYAKWEECIHEWDSGTVTTEPTCTKEGVLTYTCTNCEERKTEPIDMIPHEVSFIEGVPGTCTEPGLAPHYGCENCDTVFSDATGKRIIPREKIIEGEPLGHNMQHIEGVPATCATEGTKSHWKCTRCSKHFEESDWNGNIPLEESSDVFKIAKLPHTWIFIDFTWNGNSAKANYSCVECNEKESVDANVELSGGTNPTCTEDGWATFTATISEEDSLDGTAHSISKDDVNGKTGHNWEFSKFVWSGSPDPTSAVAEFICKNNEEHVSHAKATLSKNVTPATCTEDGKVVWTATVASDEENNHSGEVLSDTQEKDIPKKGHDWKFENIEWTKTEDGYSAKANYVCKNDSEHKSSVNAIVDTSGSYATCEDPGKLVYKAEISASDSLDGKAITEEKEVKSEPLTHNWEFNKFKWTGNDEDGYTSVIAEYTCKNDSDHVKEIQMDLNKIKTDPNCTTDGIIVYTATLLKANTPDDESREVSKTVTLSKLNHDWKFVDFKWTGNDEDGYTAVANYVCQNNDEHKQSVNAVVKKTVEDTVCESGGEIKYVAEISSENALDKKAQNDEKVIHVNPLGHNWKLDHFEWHSDGKDGFSHVTGHFVCNNNESHTKEIQAGLNKNTENPSCTDDGKTTWTATIDITNSPSNKKESETKTITIPKKGHNYEFKGFTWNGNEDSGFEVKANFECINCNEPNAQDCQVVKEVRNSTCTEKGCVNYIAKLDSSGSCDKKIHEDEKNFLKDANGHDLQHIEKKNATCTEDGNIEYWHCSSCGVDFDSEKTDKKPIISDVVIKSNGHDYDMSMGKIIKKPNCEEEGIIEYPCKNCHNNLSKALKETGHKYGEWEYCDNSYHQKVCKNNAKHTEIEKHVWDDGTITKEPTITDNGEKTFICKTCGGSKTEKLPKAKATGMSLKIYEHYLKSLDNDKDPKGAKVAPLCLRSLKQTSKSITIKWNKAPKAKRYIIYANECNNHGKTFKYKKYKTVNKNKRYFTIKKIKSKKLKRGKYYKFIMVAIGKDGKVITTSKTIHVATKGGKYGNHKQVKAKNVKVKVGKKAKIKAKAVSGKKRVKIHRNLCYESSNPKVATVSKKGVVKGKTIGNCKIYVYAQSGTYKTIKVKVDR